MHDMSSEISDSLKVTSITIPEATHQMQIDATPGGDYQVKGITLERHASAPFTVMVSNLDPHQVTFSSFDKKIYVQSDILTHNDSKAWGEVRLHAHL